jgi:hypothetical protein
MSTSSSDTVQGCHWMSCLDSGNRARQRRDRATVRTMSAACACASYMAERKFSAACRIARRAAPRLPAVPHNARFRTLTDQAHPRPGPRQRSRRCGRMPEVSPVERRLGDRGRPRVTRRVRAMRGDVPSA